MTRAYRRSASDDRGSVLVTVTFFLPVLLVFAAFVLDVGHAFQLRRHLQSAADAAALAAAQELPDTSSATSVANDYSASTGGRNENANLPAVTTAVTFPGSTPGAKVKVTQSAQSRVFFAGIVTMFGAADWDGFAVTASAVASKTSTAAGTPLAVYVHELCGASSGNKGLIAAGDNMRIEGGIHVNGQFKIGNPGFNSVGKATVYRPSAGSPPGPAQGTCNGAAPLRIEDINGGSGPSTYCTGCSTGPVTDPAPAGYRDWVTPYHTEAIMKGYTPCTYNWTGDRVYHNTTIPSGVHCVPPDKKFTISGTSSGDITVIAGFIEVGGAGLLRPYNPDHPVLFYSTNTAGTAIKMNPSAAYDWTGYIINRKGGIEINAAGVTSPFNGLLEAEWILVNGENFRMLGTFPESSDGPMTGAVALEE
ncbi:MAG TPA: pilus assembly protein TadG-related protein [Gaiellaceae bacterium]|nr:pilus assembly protein TadG-related protein [Gaiellaceae bacterium]